MPKNPNAPRVLAIASSATPSVDVDLYDELHIMALAVDISSITTTGSPADGQILRLVIRDNGTSRKLTYGTSFPDIGEGTPSSATTANNVTILEFVYDSSAPGFVFHA